MADVTGPISTLPGHTADAPQGQMCDDHPDRPAYRRVQGETDSFGSEQYDMCVECYDRHRTEMAALREKERTGMCDWCKTHATDLRNRRDLNEGMCGPVYRVCGACIRLENEELQAELDGDYDDYDYDYDEDWEP